MSLPFPINSVLQQAALDAPVSRGWARIQRKRRVRDTARKSVLAVSCLLLAAAVGWAVRPLFPGASSSRQPVVAVKSETAAPKPAALDALVKELPKVQGRAQLVQRPVPPPAAPASQQEQVALPEPELDVVAALLESVRDAYDQGNMARATVLLTEIAQKHEDDRRAAQALYVLGLIQLERRRDAKGAAASFNHALELSPPPELVPALWQALERARDAQ